MSKTVLYEFDVSPFCEKVRRILHYKGVPYVRRECAAMTPMQWKKINHRAKFPALVHEGKTVVDSSDIARFLEGEAPERPLIPEDSGQRAFVELLEDWADESLFWYEVYLRFGVKENAERVAAHIASHVLPPLRPIAMRLVPWKTMEQARAQGIGRKPLEVVLEELRGHYAMLATFLRDRPYLSGPGLTLADIAVSAQLWALIDSGQRPEIEKHPRLAAWYD
ncbi:MAG: glutathione S-transferase family protein, partial [Candidatus Methylomirabilis sp.]|nr:glutathione S-transferase family protein [Deltaproteobacteria bacterium]